VTGDFNSLPDSDVYLDMMGKLEKSFEITVLRGPETKFICDSNLNRLCRWMRVLGIDTALDKDDSSIEGGVSVSGSKSGQPKSILSSYERLFERARAEKRVLLTSSKRLQQLASCPQSFTVDPGNLEDTLVAICREFSIELNPRNFLTVIKIKVF
jgi:uncharacterized protein with PIN domain